MTISRLNRTTYYALHERNGEKFVGLGFNHTDALMNCLKLIWRKNY